MRRHRTVLRENLVPRKGQGSHPDQDLDRGRAAQGLLSKPGETNGPTTAKNVCPSCFKPTFDSNAHIPQLAVCITVFARRRERQLDGSSHAWNVQQREPRGSPMSSLPPVTHSFLPQIIDRGIALRKNLCLPQSQTTSIIIHGLQAGETYSFTVSCVAEVEGALRHVSTFAFASVRSRDYPRTYERSNTL